ncbi:MAG: DUF397 domain-containing protein [Actinophytocola sp.]|uniref:DUF397 domain-containing protein n=1 Tax=Actinophytocola sp. TaxID=1872138 RepID=UPI001323F50A|nr:DUF397 domain-containing protein [Actinophytocola sp.]MPZ79473.1 DUF397 domain-containing protein [Actinophytocola sp.]
MHTPIPSNAGWRRSSLSDGGENCVELSHGEDWAAARDSKNKNRLLPLTPAAFTAFRGAVKTGRLDH